jgi:LemA protein
MKGENKMTIWIVVAVIVVLLIFVVLMFNTLIGKKNQVTNVFGTIDALLKKRYDLLPKLITAVKEYMKHERGVLEEITELRAKAVSGNLSNDQQVDLDNRISKLLGGIMVAVENYPQLKANENFMHLQRTMNEVEEQISAARRAYNAAVTDYNNAVEMFPTNIMAGMMSYRTKKVFEIPEEQRQDIDTEALFKK